ncbi:MAG: hypothetical protein M3Y41_07425 [Pseudomonadota bacterium]|nr:hypothetical protein [Pseudomonadota bacterium]
MSPLLDVKALAFDTGGTVLDWHSGMTAALVQLRRRHGIERDWAEFAREYRRGALKRMKNQVAPSFNMDDAHREMLERLLEEHGLDAFTVEIAVGSCRRGTRRPHEWGEVPAQFPSQGLVWTSPPPPTSPSWRTRWAPDGFLHWACENFDCFGRNRPCSNRSTGSTTRPG